MFRFDWMILVKGIFYIDFNVINLNLDKDYCFRVRVENDMGISDLILVVMVKKWVGEIIFNFFFLVIKFVEVLSFF